MDRAADKDGCNSPHNSEVVANTVEGSGEDSVEVSQAAHCALADKRTELWTSHVNAGVALVS